MKILIVGSRTDTKGGISTVIKQLINEYEKDKNIDYRFVASYCSGNKLRQITFFIKSIFYVIYQFYMFKPDFMHFHMSYKGSYVRKNIVCKIAWKFEVPTILHLHGSEFKKWFDSLDIKKQRKVGFFLEKQKIIIVLGKEWAEIIKKIAPKSEIRILNNAVTIPKKTVNFSSEPLNILFYAVLLKRKGVYDLINVIEKISLKQKTDSFFYFTIAGTGPELNNLKKIVSEKKLSNYVNFIGWVDENKREKLILSHQVGVLPSYNEGLPMTILECMSYGLPMIATDVGSVSSVVNNKNGKLIEPGNSEAIFEEIIKLQKNYEYWKYKSKNSINIIKEKFDIDVLYESLISIYKEIIIKR